MIEYLTSDEELTLVADAIRARGRTNGQIVYPNGFVTAIEDITPLLQTKTTEPTENAQVVEADTGYEGLSSVTVNAIPSSYVGSGIPRRTSANLTVSGDTVIVTPGYYSAEASKAVASGSVEVPNTSISVTPSISVSTGGLITASVSKSQNVSPVVEEGYVTDGTAGTMNVTGSNTDQLPTQAAISITPSENAQTINTKGKFMLGTVSVSAIPNDFVGSGITRRDSDDLTTSGASVTVPAGYYESTAQKRIADGEASVDATSITANPVISINDSGVIQATVTKTQSIGMTVTPGYISIGSPGTATISGSKTYEMNTQTALSITPTETAQNAIVPAYTYTLGDISVKAIPSSYVGSAITRVSATTYYPSTSARTIVAGSYLTGAQTIAAVTLSNISEENIKNGVVVKVGDSSSAGRLVNVTGTFTSSTTVSSGQTAAAAGQIRTGYSAWVNGAEVKGSIANLTAKTYYTSTEDQTITTGKYISGVQTIKAVTTTNLTAANIKAGAVVYVGDGGLADRIASVTGTFTSDGTAVAGNILKDKIAYVNGNKITGNIESLAATTYNASTSAQTIAAGKYLSGAQTIRAITTANITAGNIKTGVTVTVGDSGSATRIKNVEGTFTAADTVSSGQTAAAAAQIRTGYSAWVGGSEIKGSIANLAAATYNTSSSDQTISAGKYISGAQTIKAVTTANISAANIKTGVTIKVGDANDDDRIKNVTGTFTAANTVSSGQTAAAAAQIRSGYSAWVGGAEVKGSLATITMPTAAASSATSGYTSKATIGRSTADQFINIPAGYNASNVYYKVSAVANMTLPTAAASSATSGYTSKATISRSTADQYINIPTGYNTAGAYYKVSAVANGSATTPATTITVAPSISIDSAGKITASNSGSKSVTPTVSAGYVSSGTAGTVTVNGSNTKQMTVKAATTYNASTSEQSIAASTYLTGKQTIRAITTSNITAANIKQGVTIKVGDSGSATRIANVTGTCVPLILPSDLAAFPFMIVPQKRGTSNYDYPAGTVTDTETFILDAYLGSKYLGISKPLDLRFCVLFSTTITIKGYSGNTEASSSGGIALTPGTFYRLAMSGSNYSTTIKFYSYTTIGSSNPTYTSLYSGTPEGYTFRMYYT